LFDGCTLICYHVIIPVIMEVTMVRTQIQLTERQAAALKKLSISRHQSISELIRQAVDTMIKTGAVVDVEDKRKRALAIVGRFRSGKRDISKEHDKYLGESFGK